MDSNIKNRKFQKKYFSKAIAEMKFWRIFAPH